jgi:hypothetical protein
MEPAREVFQRFPRIENYVTGFRQNRLKPDRHQPAFFDFVLPFCDTQSGGFFVVSTVVSGSKPASNFVIQVLGEIENDRMTVLAEARIHRPSKHYRHNS